jgi:hypothetical protein
VHTDGIAHLQVVKFAEYGPQRAHLTFKFQNAGGVTLWATPNRRSKYQMQNVLVGTCPGKAPPPFEMLADSLEPLSRTIELYETTLPWNDYGALLDVWAEYSPILNDSGPGP